MIFSLVIISVSCNTKPKKIAKTEIIEIVEDTKKAVKLKPLEITKDFVLGRFDYKNDSTFVKMSPAYSSKELCREFAVPTVTSFKKLKRLSRYLSGMSRLVYHYAWQGMPTEIDVYVDTDFAGCRETRRSTSGGVAMLGGCCIKHWSKT